MWSTESNAALRSNTAMSTASSSSSTRSMTTATFLKPLNAPQLSARFTIIASNAAHLHVKKHVENSGSCSSLSGLVSGNITTIMMIINDLGRQLQLVSYED